MPGTLPRPACGCAPLRAPARGAAGWSSSAWAHPPAAKARTHIVCSRQGTLQAGTAGWHAGRKAACPAGHKLPSLSDTQQRKVGQNRTSSAPEQTICPSSVPWKSACLSDSISATETAHTHLQSNLPPIGSADADVDHGQPAACWVLQHALIPYRPRHLRHLRAPICTPCRSHVLNQHRAGRISWSSQSP